MSLFICCLEPSTDGFRWTNWRKSFRQQRSQEKSVPEHGATTSTVMGKETINDYDFTDNIPPAPLSGKYFTKY